MGAGASVESQDAILNNMSEEQAAERLAAMYKKDPQKVQRILAQASLGGGGEVTSGSKPFEDIATAHPTDNHSSSPLSAVMQSTMAAPALAAAEDSLTPSAPSPSDSHSAAEKIVSAINAVRTDPKCAINFLRERLTRFDGKKLRSRNKGQPNIMTAEGPAAVEECITYLEGADSVPPLDLAPGLCRAAEDHLQDIGSKGLASHVGSDGSSMQDRIEKWGDWKDVIGENLDFCNEDPMDIVLSLLVDDNVPSRGHRKNLMNDRFKVVGIAWGQHIKYRYACVMNFSGGFGPKTRKLNGPARVWDAVIVDNNVQAILDSIPFDDLKQQVVEALSANGARGVEEQQTVDLDYKPGEIEVRLKNKDGATVLRGTWTVQHSSAS